MKILFWAADGLGGTEKTAVVFAVGLVARGNEVLYPCDPTGPRAPQLINGGVRLVGKIGNDQSLRDFLDRENVDIVYQYVPGYQTLNPIYSVLSKYPDPKPLLVENNVFGWFEDPLSEKYAQLRFFISMASGVQAFRRAKRPLTEAALARNSVLYNSPSIHGDLLLAPEARQQFRAKLGVKADEVLAIRIGRAGRKWTSWECEAYAIARKEVPGLRLLLLEPPAYVKRKIQSGCYGDGIIVLPETSDFEWLGQLCRSADLMIHASFYGESFGCTIGEAMEAALPLIVLSSPWGDNAQVELVKHGSTGHVCCSVRGMAESLIRMGRDRDLRLRMGEAGRLRITRLCDMEHEIAILDESFRALHEKTTSPLREARSRQWQEFSTHFHEMERNTLEKELGWWSLQVQSAAYSAYRRTRTAFGRFLKKFKKDQ